MKLAAGFAFAFLTAASSFAGPITFIALNDPNATGGTYAWGINNAGQIVGNYVDSIGDHGLYYDGTTYTTLDDPNASALGTIAFGVNDSSQIVGYYIGADGQEHGFLYDGSTYTTLEHPGFSSLVPRGINNSGQIVGTYDDATGEHGFSFVGGTWTTVDSPDAALYGGIIRSFALGVSNSGLITGYYQDASGFEHGFLYDGSTHTKLDDPNASAQFGGTVAFGVNSNGHVAGRYYDSTNQQHSFFYDGLSYTTLEDPYAVATGINDHDQIVGFYAGQPSSTPGSTPEPGTAGLLLLGCAFLCGSRRLIR